MPADVEEALASAREALKEVRETVVELAERGHHSTAVELLASAVEITVRPDLEDIEQPKVGVGALENAWGRRPSLLVIWSESGLVPEHVVREADRLGIRIARGPGELKALLDEVASGGARR